MFTIKEVIPSVNELTPSLHVHLEVQYDLKNSCHLEVKGSMFSSDHKLLSTGEEIRNSVNDQISACDINVTNNSAHQPFNTVLRFLVEPKSFNHIQSLRLASENNDVFLNFVFKVVVIEHNFGLKNNILVLRDTNHSLGRVNLFKIKEFKESKNRHRIPSADWVNKYMDGLGFGKSILFEINQPSLDNITNFKSTDIDVPRFNERIEAVISGLSIMQDYIKKREWNQVAEQFRDIDLFRADMTKDLKTLLKITTNLPEEKCLDFTMALDKLYSVASQFHHPLNKGKVNPIMNVNKEDAYFIYMLMLSITQLLIKKVEYLRRHPP